MKALEQEVVALLHSRNARRRSTGRHRLSLPGGRPGDASHQGAAGCGGCRQASSAMGGPIHGGGTNTNTLTLPRRFKCSPTVNVDRLKPYYSRAGRPAPPRPVSDPGQAGEYVVEQLLNRKTLRGRTYYLVRWQGHASADDSWEPVEHLAHCPERVAEYEAAAPRRPKARRLASRGAPGAVDPQPPPDAVPPPPPPPTAGWVVGPAGQCWPGAGASRVIDPLLVAGRGLAAQT